MAISGSSCPVAGEPVHDDGYDIEVRYLKTRKDDGMAHYETRWYNPVAGGEYRFVIEGRAGQPALYSAPFHWLAGQQPVAAARIRAAFLPDCHIVPLGFVPLLSRMAAGSDHGQQ